MKEREFKCTGTVIPRRFAARQSEAGAPILSSAGVHCFDTFVKPNLVASTYCELTLGSYLSFLRGDSSAELQHEVTYYAFN